MCRHLIFYLDKGSEGIPGQYEKKLNYLYGLVPPGVPSDKNLWMRVRCKCFGSEPAEIVRDELRHPEGGERDFLEQVADTPTAEEVIGFPVLGDGLSFQDFQPCKAKEELHPQPAEHPPGVATEGNAPLHFVGEFPQQFLLLVGHHFLRCGEMVDV